MSILSELKKLTGKNNATTISKALPDNLNNGSGLPDWSNAAAGQVLMLGEQYETRTIVDIVDVSGPEGGAIVFSGFPIDVDMFDAIDRWVVHYNEGREHYDIGSITDIDHMTLNGGKPDASLLVVASKTSDTSYDEYVFRSNGEIVKLHRSGNEHTQESFEHLSFTISGDYTKLVPVWG